MRRLALTPELLELVADRFRALAEPVRLRILSVLRAGELTVTELAEETGLGQANLSKHLQLLHALGFVTRRKAGLYVFYALADDDVFELCDIMCGRLGAEARRQGRALAAGAAARS
ncbi:MAG: ArsR/SmtB family transcription factor [Gemmatimonadaceae bacterium]